MLLGVQITDQVKQAVGHVKALGRDRKLEVAVQRSGCCIAAQQRQVALLQIAGVINFRHPRGGQVIDQGDLVVAQQVVAAGLHRLIDEQADHGAVPTNRAGGEDLPDSARGRIRPARAQARHGAQAVGDERMAVDGGAERAARRRCLRALKRRFQGHSAEVSVDGFTGGVGAARLLRRRLVATTSLKGVAAYVSEACWLA